MRALVVVAAVVAACPAWADATVPQAAPATSRAEACKARMDEARKAVAATAGFADARLVLNRNSREEWEVVVTATSGGHELRAMAGTGNSGQWSFFPRDRWFDNSGMWKMTFRMERYPRDHDIAAIIEGDHIPLRRARAFAALVRPALDDCLAMPR